MKKFTAILMTILMVLGCCSVMTVSAVETATITVNGSEYTAAVGSTVVYSVDLKVANTIVNGEFNVNYPQSVIEITDVDFPVIGKGGVTYNYTENRVDCLSFNFSNLAGYNFSNGGDLVKVTFEVKSAGTGAIALSPITMASVNNDYVINDELSNATFTQNITTEPIPETSVAVKAGKSKIYVGASTTVSATVQNGSGDTTFKSSNSKVAKVSATGVVKGVKAGSAKITATNNGKSASVTITVVKKASKLTVKGKTVTAKAKKKTTIKASKAITVKNAKGTVTYKKKSGDKKITVAKNGKITVKKGLKKGKTYKLKVTVKDKGDSKVKAGSKVATVKIKVK